VQSAPRPRRYIRGVLQCVAVCCSVLQRVAVCCSVLQCVAVLATALHSRKGNGAEHVHSTPRQRRYVEGVLQCVAACCIAVCCKRKVQSRCQISREQNTALQHTATHCNTLQHTATHCNTLQHTTTHCNTLQHTSQVALNTPRATALYFKAFHTCFWQKSPKYGAAPRRDILRCFLSMLSLCEGCSATPATHCNTLQHTVTHCNALQYTRTRTF